MGDMGEAWDGYREAQQARRSERLPARTADIRNLESHGYTVRKITDYQFRINELVDLYPTHRRFHDLTTGQRGRYTSPAAILISLGVIA